MSNSTAIPQAVPVPAAFPHIVPLPSATPLAISFPAASTPVGEIRAKSIQSGALASSLARVVDDL